ncbi:MAG TPA: DUF3488 and transglutaminase-like domain-containing protein [Galbitalea sp.]
MTSSLMPTLRAAFVRPGLPKPTPSMDLRMSGLLLLAVAVATSGLHSLLADFTWWFATTGVALVVLGVAAAVRYYLQRRWAGTVAGLVAGLVLIVLFFGGGTAVLGIIPTGATFEHFGQLANEATDSIARQSVPAFVVPGIQFLLCWSIGGIAVVLDALAIWARIPALTGIPLLIVTAVPSVVQPALSDALFFAMTAAAYLLIVRNRVRRVQPGIAVVLGTVAVLGALLVPALLPPVAPANANGSGIGVLAESINPIINLGQDLRNSDPVEALSYTTTASTGQYLRLTTLDNFQGKQWAPDVPKPVASHTVAKFADPPGLTTAVSSFAVSTKISVANTTGQWLPTPYPPTSIKGLTGTWLWSTGTLAVRSDNANMRGQNYTVNSIDVEPTIQQMEGAPRSTGSKFAAVPSGLDPIVAKTAKQVVGNAKTDFDKAVALQNWFQGGTFTYSTRTPASEGFDGAGLDVIVPFLQAKTGYCVHFATTMAVMARTLGIPSRVAVGFLPGKVSHPGGIAQGKSLYTVSSSDLHAWPELYFKNVGWVRFEPTPSRGFEPNFPAAPSNGSSGAPTSAPTTAPSSAASSSPAPRGPKISDDNTTASGSGVSTGAVSPVGWAGLGILLVLLLIATPAIVRTSVRRRRLERIRQGIEPASGTWEELRDSARDLGLDAPSSRTPAELSAYLAVFLEQAPESDRAAALDALAELRGLVEDEAYGPPAYNYYGERLASALVVVLGGMRRAAATPDRLRALLLPSTLIDRAMGRVNPATR